MAVRCTKTNVCTDTKCIHYDKHEPTKECERKVCVKDKTIVCTCKR